MANPNRLKARLAAGETVTAAWLEFGSPDVAEALVRTGWDVVVVDCEHGAAGLEGAWGLIRAVEAAGGEAVLRVPDLTEATFKRALDRGARSLMAPMVNDAATAAQVAAFCRYPPLGRRGYAAPIVRASGFGARADYRATAHEELLLMVQVEHVDAVRDLEAIAAVPGVDMAFVGPNDLAGSIGLLERLTDPKVAALHADVERRAAVAGLMLGTITGEGRDWATLKRLGYRFLVGPNDISLLTAASRAAAQARDDAMG